MGDFLKQAYAFKRINDLIDQEQNKLSDKIDHLSLSHNRKIKALKKIQTIVENYCFTKEDQGLKKEILKQCENALFSNGREREKKCGK